MLRVTEFETPSNMLVKSALTAELAFEIVALDVFELSVSSMRAEYSEGRRAAEEAR